MDNREKCPNLGLLSLEQSCFCHWRTDFSLKLLHLIADLKPQHSSTQSIQHHRHGNYRQCRLDTGHHWAAALSLSTHWVIVPISVDVGRHFGCVDDVASCSVINRFVAKIGSGIQWNPVGLTWLPSWNLHDGHFIPSRVLWWNFYPNSHQASRNHIIISQLWGNQAIQKFWLDAQIGWLFR